MQIRVITTLILISLSILLTSCRKDEDIPEIIATEISDSFESGSIGNYTKISDTEWELYIADDNGNETLPDSWRSWWYVRLDNLSDGSPLKLTIKNSGWDYLYNPVYSYDQKEWFRFNTEEISQNSNNELVIDKIFSQSRVWIAMFYPYTLTDLEEYINHIKDNPALSFSVAGTSQLGNPVYVLKVTDFTVPETEKKRILIHARTHPAETPPSFLLEGMINFLLSGSAEAREMLRAFEFHIFPMQNVDGVIAGNYRSTPQSENLEMLWTYNYNDPINLTPEAPVEVDIIHQYAKSLMTDGGPAVSIALNLHASNSQPDIRPFFFPHFGPEEYGYSSTEASLWEKQLHFISSFGANHGFNKIEPVPTEGGSSFANKTYPESWWWINYHDQVMAITMEMTYGRSGYYPNWIKPPDMRLMGESLALGIRDYFNNPVTEIPLIYRIVRTDNIKYNSQYPPFAPDELKE